MTEKQSIIIQELIIKKYKAPDGREFNTEMEAMHYAMECLKPKVYVLLRLEMGIGNAITIECVYDNLFMAQEALESLNNMPKTREVSYYLQTHNIVEASDAFKKSTSLGLAEEKMKDAATKYSWGNKKNPYPLNLEHNQHNIMLCSEYNKN
jgi:hypothetical protein